MKIVLDGGIMPTRAHPWDAGLDLYTPMDVTVPGCSIRGWVKDKLLYGKAEVGSTVIDTLVRMEIPEGFVGFIKSKSGLNVKHGLTTDSGVIDCHYTGTIRVKIYNNTRKEYHFKAGDKIAQIVILPCARPHLEVVDSLKETDRGENGFGSTGR